MKLLILVVLAAVCATFVLSQKREALGKVYIDRLDNIDDADEDIDELLGDPNFVRALMMKVNSMDKELGSLKYKVLTLENRIGIQETEIGELKQELDEVKRGPASESKDDQTDSKIMNATKEEYEEFAIQGRKLSRGIRETGRVAFTAYLDGGDLKTLGIGHTVKCNQVITNIGNGYNTYTGVFTVPQTGLYFVTFTIHGIDKDTDIKVVLDGNNLLDAAVHNRGARGHTAYFMSSNSCVVQLQEGQSLWLENFVNVGELYGSDSFRHTTFTAFMLF